MSSRLDQVPWRTPLELLAANDVPTWEAFSEQIHHATPGLVGEVRVIPSSTSRLQFGLHHPNVEMVESYSFPVSMEEIRLGIRDLNHLAVVALADPDGQNWHAIHDLLDFIGATDVDAVVDWVDENLFVDPTLQSHLDSVTAYDHKDDDSKEGISLDFTTQDGAVACLWWFPFGPKQFRTTVLEMNSYARGMRDRDRFPLRPEPDALSFFPFLHVEVDELGDNMRSAGYTRLQAREFTRRWAEMRLRSVLDELPAAARNLINIDPSTNSVEIAEWVTDEVEYWTDDLPDWGEETGTSVSPPPLPPQAPPTLTLSVQPSSVPVGASSPPWGLAILPCAVAAAMLLASYGAHPYAFYEVLRWVVCGCALASIYILLHDREQSRGSTPLTQAAATLLAGVAIVFNPIVPVESDRGFWSWMDGAAISIFALTSYLLWRKQRSLA